MELYTTNIFNNFHVFITLCMPTSVQSSCQYDPSMKAHSGREAGVGGNCMFLDGTIYSDASAAWVLIAAIIVFFMVSGESCVHCVSCPPSVASLSPVVL